MLLLYIRTDHPSAHNFFFRSSYFVFVCFFIILFRSSPHLVNKHREERTEKKENCCEKIIEQKKAFELKKEISANNFKSFIIVIEWLKIKENGDVSIQNIEDWNFEKAQRIEVG